MALAGRSPWALAAAGALAANLLPLLYKLPVGQSMWCWQAGAGGTVIPNAGGQPAGSSYYTQSMQPCGEATCASITHYCHVREQCAGNLLPASDDALASVQGRRISCPSMAPAPGGHSHAGDGHAGTAGGVKRMSGAVQWLLLGGAAVTLTASG
eukprot:CAMPEP_0204530086 /NCGR_PEP_ID=MMETSP0661-20131031/10422_1 /ASSEMBLY_ACC=CAM_ASM_000606 /TAXON_ID=109239 /ORGANISM="Alexandrium margalefi, Strain AMGDE01CS-322" /LENGTH=153 /DNA_ID=CAMNT_0051536147 /DNA_START=99 /DNA_END=560 /DNA_ORIENTATION=+